MDWFRCFWELLWIVEGVAPYKIVYRRKTEKDANEDSMTLSDFDESEGEDSEEK